MAFVVCYPSSHKEGANKTPPSTKTASNTMKNDKGSHNPHYTQRAIKYFTSPPNIPSIITTPFEHSLISFDKISLSPFKAYTSDMCLYRYYQCKSPPCDALGYPVIIRCADNLAGRDCEVTQEIIVGSDYSCSICYLLFPEPIDQMAQILEQMGLQSPTSEQSGQPPPPPPPSPATVEEVVQGLEELNLTVPATEESLEGAMKGTQLEDPKTDQKGDKGK